MQQGALSITSIPKKQYEELKSIISRRRGWRIFKKINEKVLVTNFNLQQDGLMLILQGNDLLQYQSNVIIGKSSVAVHMNQTNNPEDSYSNIIVVQEAIRLTVNNDIFDFVHQIMDNWDYSSINKYIKQLSTTSDGKKQLNQYQSKLRTIQELSQQSKEKKIGKKLLRFLNNCNHSLLFSLTEVELNYQSESVVSMHFEVINPSMFSTTVSGQVYANIINVIQVPATDLQITNSLQPIFKADLHDFRFMTRSKEAERKLVTAIIIGTRALDIRVNDIDKNAGEVIKVISKIGL